MKIMETSSPGSALAGRSTKPPVGCLLSSPAGIIYSLLLDVVRKYSILLHGYKICSVRNGQKP